MPFDGVLMYSRGVIESGVRGGKVIRHQFGEIELLDIQVCCIKQITSL